MNVVWIWVCLNAHYKMQAIYASSQRKGYVEFSSGKIGKQMTWREAFGYSKYFTWWRNLWLKFVPIWCLNLFWWVWNIYVEVYMAMFILVYYYKMLALLKLKRLHYKPEWKHEWNQYKALWLTTSRNHYHYQCQPVTNTKHYHC